jgi:hypothetical protein
VKHLVLICVLVLSLSAEVRADGGAVRLTERIGDYRVTVFTTPTPLRAGPVDISVFVQDAGTGAPIAELPVTIHLTQGDRAIDVPLLREAATNKLFQAAQVEVPCAGVWQAEVRIAGEEKVARFDLDVDEAMPRWTEMWFWIALPLVPIVLFALHQWFTQRHARLSVSSS